MKKKKRVFTRTHKRPPSRKDGPKGLWNPTKHGVTNSRLTAFVACREHFRLKYDEGWKVEGTSDALDFGSAFHRMMEDCHALAKWATMPIERKIRHFKSQKTKLLREYHASSDNWEKKNHWTKIVGLAAVSFEAYTHYYHEEDADKTWLKREHVFNVPRTFSVPRLHAMFPKRVSLQVTIPLWGYIDGLFLGINPSRKKLGPATASYRGHTTEVTATSPKKLYVHETKTRGRIDEDGISANLDRDMQSMLYCWGIIHDHRFMKHNFGGYLYDVIKKPGIRQGMKESDQDYVKRAQDVVDSKGNDHHKRWYHDLTIDAVEKWATTVLDPILRELYEWWWLLQNEPKIARLYHFYDPGSVYTKYGRSDFFKLITSGDTTGLARHDGSYEPFTIPEQRK